MFIGGGLNQKLRPMQSARPSSSAMMDRSGEDQRKPGRNWQRQAMMRANSCNLADSLDEPKPLRFAFSAWL
jgi:hypothetical protein